jgi:hypothetical protein
MMGDPWIVDWGVDDSVWYIILNYDLLKQHVSPYITSDGQEYFPITLSLATVLKPHIGEIVPDKNISDVGVSLSGYLRKSTKGDSLRLSLNKQALEDAEEKTGSNLVFRGSGSAIIKVLAGERAVTTLSFHEDSYDVSVKYSAINWDLDKIINVLS